MARVAKPIEKPIDFLLSMKTKYKIFTVANENASPVWMKKEFRNKLEIPSGSISWVAQYFDPIGVDYPNRVIWSKFGYIIPSKNNLFLVL